MSRHLNNTEKLLSSSTKKHRKRMDEIKKQRLAVNAGFRSSAAIGFGTGNWDKFDELIDKQLDDLTDELERASTAEMGNGTR